MHPDLKKLQKKLKQSTHSLNDWFMNPIEQGDVVLVSDHGRFTPHVVLGINESSVSISCVRETSTRKVWDRTTNTYIDGKPHTYVADTPNLGYWEHHVGNIAKILESHNSKKYLYIYGRDRMDNEICPLIVNLTKLIKFTYESTED